METRKVYRSGISMLIAIPLLLAFLIAGYSSIDAKHIVPGIILVLAFGIIILPLIFGTVYTINGNMLNVKSGFLINKNIDINAITKIVATSSVLSAPAVSFDRIEVFYNKYDSVVISPRDKQLFAENLKQINQSIVVSL